MGTPKNKTYKPLKPSKHFYNLLCKVFPFEPTQNQKIFLETFSKFIFDTEKDKLLVLKGYAGTGKTTLLSCIIPHLKNTGYRSILLAPTGKAAKVMSSYAKTKAYTIHKKIYYPKTKSSGTIEFTKKTNKHTNTFFFIDEASMISDDSHTHDLFKKDSLLNDLIEYVYTGKNCFIVLIGDTAQLPPVKMPVSPALDEAILRDFYDKKITCVALEQVMRQHQNSGILYNATALRECINKSIFDFQFDLNFADVICLKEPYELQEALMDCFHQKNISDTAVILRSNKRANIYNLRIRLKIRNFEEQINVGDHLMVVKNNYFWVQPTSQMGFIANGDTFEILEILEQKHLYDFSFARVKIRFLDYPDEPALETVLLLDTLQCETPNLPYEDNKRLYKKISEDYPYESNYKKMLRVKKNDYYNALQVKYAYALTCHKSQGGQWDNIFVEKPYLPEGQNKEYFRWLYTAITRTKKKLYLIGFHH